jgi:hypothetical protein
MGEDLDRLAGNDEDGGAVADGDGFGSDVFTAAIGELDAVRGELVGQLLARFCCAGVLARRVLLRRGSGSRGSGPQGAGALTVDMIRSALLEACALKD